MGAALFFGVWSFLIAFTGAVLVTQTATPQGAMPAAGVLGSSRTAWYMLGADCGLSATVAASLARHGPRPGLQEQVWLTDSEDILSAPLRAAGFAVDRARAGLPAKVPGMHGGPWLALFDADGRVTFSGPFPKSWEGGDPSPQIPRWLARLAPDRR